MVILYILAFWLGCGVLANVLRPYPTKALPRFLCGPVALYVEMVEAYMNMMMDDDEDIDPTKMG